MKISYQLSPTHTTTANKSRHHPCTYLTFISHTLPLSHHSTTCNNARQVPRCNSLEESKRRAKSQYDNIPDLNQRYLAELGSVERKYGPARLQGKDLIKEAQQSILRPEGGRSPKVSENKASVAASELASDEPADMSGYVQIRNRLLVDTITVALLGASAFWMFGTIRATASFGVGALGSVAFVILLSRSVDKLAEAARTNGVQAGDPLQPARIGIIVFLVLASAKNRNTLDVLPVLLGFFSYKVASLLPLFTGEAFD